MRQISLRQEASRLGGIGSCGRELCCSTWLVEFKSVSTSAARYQNLSLNPSKLSGQCGRLKCCLNYELESYLDALQEIPKLEGSLKDQKRISQATKKRIFLEKTMWFGYEQENSWHAVSCQRVKEIIDLNKKGVLPETLLENEATNGLKHMAAINQELQRMDQKYAAKNKRRPKKSKNKNRQ